MTREEAIEVVKELKPNNRLRKALRTLVPELQESEDERTINELIAYLTHRADVTEFIDEGVDCKRWISYLEKQKEMIDSLTAGLDRMHERVDGLIQENNSLYMRLEQKPVEWSEEDKNAIRFSIDWLSIFRDRHAINQKTKEEVSFCIDKLKSLRPQPHWKPSEEQMGDLSLAATMNSVSCPSLKSLYDDLKKL